MSDTNNTGADARRTPLQAETSRINGTKSSGPVSDEGKQRASLNSTRHGMNADFLVLPHEDVEEYQEMMNSWADALAPTSLAEAQLVSAIGDAAWKLQRLRRIQHERELAVLETKVQDTPEWHRAKMAEQAREAVAALAHTVEARQAVPGALSEMAGFIQAVKTTVRMVQLVETLPLVYLDLLEGAVADLEQNSTSNVSVVDYLALGTVAKTVATALEPIVEREQATLPALKTKIAATEIAMTDSDAKLAKRYMDLALSALDRNLNELKKMRELVRDINEKLKADAEDFKLRIRVSH